MRLSGLLKKKAEISSCPGYDTFGPFKLVGGIKKGHPNEAEIDAAVNFQGITNIKIFYALKIIGELGKKVRYFVLFLFL